MEGEILHDHKIALFKGKKIRKIIYNKEWCFSVVDVVEALTESLDARDYWYRMKVRVKNEDGFQLSTICRQLKLEASDGKKLKGLKRENLRDHMGDFDWKNPLFQTKIF